jgi:heme-degrading monooxygenase HmoA
MITEIADFRVVADKQEEFADAVREGVAIVADTPGFIRARLTRSIENPSRFVLLIDWETVEAHTVEFRESERFARWRAVVGPFFDGAPHVEHVTEIASHPTS